MNILFSTMLYALGKELGLEPALQEWYRQCAEPDDQSLPAARMAARLREACIDLGLHIRNAGLLAEPIDLHGYADVGATHIGKARSRALHAAYECDADFWVSCDDDVEATQGAVTAMLRAASTPLPRIVFLPVYLRDKPIVALKFGGGSHAQEHLAPITESGTGCFVVNAAALESLARAYKRLEWRDDTDGKIKLALFLEDFETPAPGGPGGPAVWRGEDFAFCRRAALCGIELVALLEGRSSHAGQVLDLSTLRGALPV